MTHGSLFTGIGGIDLGFEWAGIETKWQVEIDDYCRELLDLRFPHTKKFKDVKEVGKHNLEQVDIISGGFPCQDISVAGKGAGIEGERSGLWSELHRVISELRPRFAFIENVPMLTIRGGTRVIADLAEIGYDAEWQIISAADVGAWHLRKRIWIVAYAGCDGRWDLQQRSIRRNGTRELAQGIDRNTKTVKTSRPSTASEVVSNTDRTGNRTSKSRTDGDRQKEDERRKGQSQFESGRHGEDVPDTESKRGRSISRQGRKPKREIRTKGLYQDVPDTGSKRLERHRGLEQCAGKQSIAKSGTEFRTEYWSTEPDVGRVANGIPKRVDRLKGIGNAVVPQIPYIIGKRLMEL